ncbi:unnamed protein product [Paramecium sonneborni]|uniref:Uncharacterized protein n=1 Tax=Paramecium sonneborni TaxID=65129 RepID=A0A8S1Q7D3_9CILI|nr:unnamed protein product [Paramecium sonneborni]
MKYIFKLNFNYIEWCWLPVPITFSIQENSTSFSLTQLPQEAQKIKLYVCLLAGDCKTGGSLVTWSLYTRKDIIKISGLPYSQNAWNINSLNCSLKLDERKIIQISRQGNYPNSINFGITVEVLGYK